MRQTVYTKYIKSVLDRLLGLLGLVCTLWLWALIAVVIVIDDPGPVLFRQRRVGMRKNGELTCFNILKFRTMRVDTPPDVPSHPLENPERHITRAGRFLRRWSLDELPQLWNIAITHDLSVVGPRPALRNQNDLIALRDLSGANDLRPGLTGWAQVNGRDELDTERKAAFDGEYVRRVGFLFDCRCVLRTIGVVLRADGVR